MSIPYASATTGTRAREEISKILRRFGSESIGFMDNYNNHELLLAFTIAGDKFNCVHRPKDGRKCF